jgi:hypothetical protein
MNMIHVHFVKRLRHHPVLLGATALIAFLATTAFPLELINDPNFLKGLNVKSVDRTINEGQFLLTAGTTPAWNLGQGGSKASIWGVNPINLSTGGKKWENIYKNVTLGPVNSDDSGLRLCIDGNAEFNGIYTANGHPIVGLVVNQGIFVGPNGWLASNRIPLSELCDVIYNVDARLTWYNPHIKTGFDTTKHVVHYLNHFELHNLGKDFMYFGLELFGSNHLTVPAGTNTMEDGYAGKWNYTMGMPFIQNSLQAGGPWVTMHGNILEYMFDGLNSAWANGHLTAGQNLDNYYIGGMNMGWEVTGLQTAALQIKNYSVQAYGFNAPKNLVGFSFYDAFTGPSLADCWKVYGSWYIANKRAYLDQNVAGPRIVYTARKYVNSDVQVDVKLHEQGAGWLHRGGIAVRMQAITNTPSESGYFCSINGNGLIEVTRGGASQMTLGSASTSFKPYRNPVRMRVNASGSTIKVYINDKLYLTVTDSTYASGHFALNAQGTKAQFDNVFAKSNP